jgi:hypothetical protein
MAVLCADANYQVLQTFFIGRAFAVTLSRRLGEAVVDVVSEVSKIIAENPKRVQEFQVCTLQQLSSASGQELALQAPRIVISAILLTPPICAAAG